MMAAVLLAACQSTPEGGNTQEDTSAQEQAVATASEGNGKKVQPPELVEKIERERADQEKLPTGEINMRSAYKYIETHPDYTYFFKIVSTTSYAKVLHNQALTVFAPTDAAFEKLPKSQLEDLLYNDNRSVRETFVARHLTDKAYTAAKVDKIEDLTDMRGVRLVGSHDPEAPISLNGLSIPRIDLQIGKSMLIATETVMPEHTIKVAPPADPGLKSAGATHESR